MFKLYYTIFCLAVSVYGNQTVDDEFKKAQITADLGLKAHGIELLEVKYNGHKVQPGETLQVSQTDNQPDLKWASDKEHLVTAIMVDPDAPSARNPTSRSWLHWMVVDINGTSTSDGHTVVSYDKPSPPPGSSYHRYVLLIYKQKDRIGSISAPNRSSFNVTQFQNRYELSGPVAGNYFLRIYD